LIQCIIGLSLIASVDCSSPRSSPGGDEQTGTSRDCGKLEPENPYPTGSGHHAGFEWAEENGPSSCDGNSPSFNEGCEEYQRQVAAYETCLGKR